MLARSLLIAPGDDERKLRRALASPAEAVVVDFEDGVAPGRKAEARDLAVRVLTEEEGAGRPEIMVRINGVDTPDWQADLDALSALQLDAIVLPKATPAALDALPDDGPPILAVIETPLGILRAPEMANHPRVVRFGLGTVDLAASLGLEPRADGLEFLHARSTLVLSSAAAGIAAPADGVHLDVGDTAGLEAQARLARSLGFAGKFCIHPSQLELVNACFSPSEDELAWAEEVVAAFGEAEREGRGVARLRDQMIDKPVALRAQRLIESHERSLR